MFKLAILTPTTGFARTIYTFSLIQMIFHFSRNQIYEGVEDQTLQYMPMEGSGIGAMREALVLEALKHDYTHVLFIDEDMGFKPNALHVLAQRKLPIVGCNYPKRVKDGGFTALSLDQSRRLVTDEQTTGLERAYYTGFGFCLVERQVFEQVEKPWFLIGYNLTTNTYSTEDAAFGKRLIDAGVEWHCDHDASKLIWHNGSYNYNFEDVTNGNATRTI